MSDVREMERDQRDLAISTATQNLAIRDSGPAQSSRTFQGSHASSWSASGFEITRHSPGDVWAGAISRLQTQVSLNTSMLESHRRQLQDVEHNLRELSQQLRDVGTVVAGIQVELRARPNAHPATRHDPGDLDVLAGQVEAVISKANEVDGLKMQVDLLKNRMKRFEDQAGPAGATHRPRTGSSYPESIHEMPGVAAHVTHSHLDHPPQHHPLPPMRTASMASPIESRTAGIPGAPPIAVMESERYSQPLEPRQYSIESSRAMVPSSTSSFRPSESLPPPSALTGWRNSDSLQHPGGLPPPPSSGSHSRPETMEPEPQHPGWASVNANQPAKRPFEEPRRSPYESPRSGSPKRPKLAPIMPRSSYGDDSYAPSGINQGSTGEASFHSRSRAPSDVSQQPSRNIPTPDSASTGSFRFITSTAQIDSQDSWRPENERMMHMRHHHHHHHGGQPGRNRGGRGRGGRGGRRGRGGGVQLPDSQQFETPEWEKPEWTGSQVSPNGYYHPLHPYAARGGRGGMGKRGGGGPGAAPDRDIEMPSTPNQDSHEPSADENGEGGQGRTSGGKKTRTKPIRNAEGVLIRKDGRPDMRSVSSANNLRKVHAKKEAEKAETNEDEDPHSVTPGTPTERDGDDAEEDERPMRQRNEELMSRIFPSSAESSRNVAERFFPRHDLSDTAETGMKTEQSVERAESESDHRNGSSQMTDVVMREMSEAQAEAHREEKEDAKMDTVEEADEEGVGETIHVQAQRTVEPPSPD